MSNKIFYSLAICLLISGCSTSTYYMKSVLSKGKKIDASKKIAIIDENISHYGTTRFISNALSTELLELDFSIVERSQIDNILAEHIAKKKGYINAEQDSISDFDKTFLNKEDIKELAKVLGADIFIFVYTNELNYSTSTGSIARLTIRWVDAKEAEVISSLTFINGDAKTFTDDREVLAFIHESVESAIKGEKVYLKEYKPYDLR